MNKLLGIFNAKPGAAPWEARIALLAVLFVALFTIANSGTECARADASCQVAATSSFASAITVNEDGNDADSRFEGDTEVNLIFVDAGNDRVGIGDSTPGTILEVAGTTTTVTASVSSGFAGAAFLDEDTLVSDSDTKVASQQSIKAYVDTEVAAGLTTYLDKTADQTINSQTALETDTHLTFTATANKNYAIWGSLIVVSPAGADIDFIWSAPASATVDTIFTNQTGDFNVSEAGEQFIGTSGSPQPFTFLGVVNMAGTGGTVVLQWAQNVSDGGNTTLFEGSWLAFQLLN